jgi:hypothetical protein
MAIDPNQVKAEEKVKTEAIEAAVEEKKKKSFVSDKDAPPVPTAGKPEQKIVTCEVSLMLIYNQAKIQTDLLRDILSVLRSGVSQTETIVPLAEPKPSIGIVNASVPAPAPVQAPAPAPTTSEPTLPETPRLKEVMTAIEPIKELVYIDVSASLNDNLFYVIRPRQFLGSENFSKVGAIMRSIGAQYQSAGKNSHFKASKAGKQ